RRPRRRAPPWWLGRQGAEAPPPLRSRLPGPPSSGPARFDPSCPHLSQSLHALVDAPPRCVVAAVEHPPDLAMRQVARAPHHDRCPLLLRERADGGPQLAVGGVRPRCGRPATRLRWLPDRNRAAARPAVSVDRLAACDREQP